MNNSEEKWDRRYLAVAELVASWSKDPSTQIGVVLVKDNRIVATGYNGFPAMIADDDRLHDRAEKYPRIVHGEMNAILQAGHEARGATLYLHSPFGGVPCSNCTKHAITAGIVRIVGYTMDDNDRWNEDCALAETMLNEAWILQTMYPR